MYKNNCTKLSLFQGSKSDISLENILAFNTLTMSENFSLNHHNKYKKHL